MKKSLPNCATKRFPERISYDYLYPSIEDALPIESASTVVFILDASSRKLHVLITVVLKNNQSYKQP